jgi:hypothetical protein
MRVANYTHDGTWTADRHQRRLPRKRFEVHVVHGLERDEPQGSEEAARHSLSTRAAQRMAHIAVS